MAVEMKDIDAIIDTAVRRKLLHGLGEHPVVFDLNKYAKDGDLEGCFKALVKLCARRGIERVARNDKYEVLVNVVFSEVKLNAFQHNYYNDQRIKNRFRNK